MKITIDSKNNSIKVGTKDFETLSNDKKEVAQLAITDALLKNTQLSEYEMDSMYMSYRYCIGRLSIASQMRAGDIWKHCKNRMSKERQLFTAYDINNEIEQCLMCFQPQFNFNYYINNRIIETGVDLVCEFMQEYNINSKEDLLKYKSVTVNLVNNKRGYEFEVETWDDYIKERVFNLIITSYGRYKNKIVNYSKEEEEHEKEHALIIFNEFKKDPESYKNDETSFWNDNARYDKLNEILSEIPKLEYIFMDRFEGLFVWNNLVHCFDFEHHHKSILTDGSECIWFWSWIHKTDENGYRTFGYEKVRIPLEKWYGNSITCIIPDESIKENIF